MKIDVRSTNDVWHCFSGRTSCRNEAHGGEDSSARGRPRVRTKAAAEGRAGEAGLADAGKITRALSEREPTSSMLSPTYEVDRAVSETRCISCKVQHKIPYISDNMTAHD